MHWNLLSLRRLLLLLALCGGPVVASAQTLALSSPTPRGVHNDEPKQKQAVALVAVLEQLEKQHNVRFNYASQLVKDQAVEEPAAPEADLEKTLTQLLKPLGLRHEKVTNQIYGIYRVPQPTKVTKTPAAERTSLREAQVDLIARLGLRPMQTVETAARTISGTVTDEDDEALPGVNVVVKNTTVGTVTDIDGNYSLTVADDAQTLVFSSVGYLTEEVTIGNQSVINLTLQPDIQSLSEVVVVGYGTQKKSDLTGAISSVEPEDITRISERRLETALQGRAAGVQVSRSEGSPGAEASVSVRGVGSIGNTQPLWVIDGVPQNPGNFFNMNDVESIEILKDASASAIYGARAAHGVILVTTKRGSEGKVKVNFNTSIGQRSPVNLPDMLDTEGFVRASSIARLNADGTPEPAWDNPESLPNTNWVDEVFSGRGLEQTYNLSVAGGNENANFFVSGGYDKEEGIMVDNSFERYALRANADFKIGKYIRIGESLLVSRTVNNPTADDGGDLITIFRAIPIMPVYDPTNPLGGWGTAPSYFQGPNPLGNQLQNHISEATNRVNGNVYAEIEPFEGLTLRGSVGVNVRAQRYERFSEAFSYGALSNSLNSLEHRSTDDESINTNLVLTYTKSIGKHDFTVLGGYERFQQDEVFFGADAQDFPISYSRSFALAAGAVNITERNTINDQYRLESLFGRVNYTFANRYLLTANVRRDGSSRFGPNFQYGVFPSISVGWRIVEEDFMQGASFLSDLKLRASYGILGSDRIDDYIFARTYRNNRSTYAFDATGQAGGNKERGFYLRRFPNEEVKWEQVVQTDIGLDASFLEGRFNVTADYYIKTTTDMLIGPQLPLSFGVSQNRSIPEGTPVNIGSVENRGFELALNYRERVGNWTFDITGNSAWNQNEVTKLDGEQTIPNGGGGPGYSGSIALTEVGQPIGYFFGLVADGIFESQSDIDALNATLPDGVFYQAEETAPGDLRYRDISGDGIINADDRTYLGNPWPKMIYGLNANVSYQNFDLTLFFQGVQGVDIFNATKAYYRTVFSDYNSSELVFESWTAENPTENPRLVASDPNGNFRNPSSYMVEDGSYLKLRNVQLGYNLPEALVGRIGLTNARVYVNAQNILTLTRYEGLDPELSVGGNANNRNTRQGIDGLGQYPQTRLLSAGLQIGF
jgi:TonB-linked SusC/RagA family outer membrane protein